MNTSDIFMKTGVIKNCKGCEKKYGRSYPVVVSVIIMKRNVWNMYKKRITAKFPHLLSIFRNPYHIKRSDAPNLVERCTRCGVEKIVEYHDMMDSK